MVRYNYTLVVGTTTYYAGGCESSEEAEYATHCMAQDDDNWVAPKLRERSWQFWRPSKFTNLEMRLLARAAAKRSEIP